MALTEQRSVCAWGRTECRGCPPCPTVAWRQWCSSCLCAGKRRKIIYQFFGGQNEETAHLLPDEKHLNDQNPDPDPRMVIIENISRKKVSLSGRAADPDPEVFHRIQIRDWDPDPSLAI